MISDHNYRLQNQTNSPCCASLSVGTSMYVSTEKTKPTRMRISAKLMNKVSHQTSAAIINTVLFMAW